MADSKTYVIVPVAELTQQMVDDCIETSLDTLRRNNINTKTILKFEGSKPASISSYTDYTHAEMLIELENVEWQSEEI